MIEHYLWHVIQPFDSFLPHRYCRSHTRCRSTPQRRSSLCWVVWRWMMRRWLRPRCKSSRTQGARWKRVSLTSNRTFHRLIDASIRSLAYSRMYECVCLIIDRSHCCFFIFLTEVLCSEHAELFVTYDIVFNGVLLPAPPSVLLPVLQAKAKRGPPRQAKYAIHCINAMFTNRDTHFAQIFEVSHILHTYKIVPKKKSSVAPSTPWP